MKFAMATLMMGLVLLACERVEVKRSYYPSGKLKQEWEATHDEYGQEVKNGVFKSWYEKGQLKTEINYLDDKKHGLQKSYYENGKLESEENYLFGKLSGKKKTWSVEGNPLVEADYLDGKQHGVFKRFLPDGSPHHEVHFRNGTKHGSHKTFDGEGNLEQLSWYEDGREVEAPPDSALAASSPAADTGGEGAGVGGFSDGENAQFPAGEKLPADN